MDLGRQQPLEMRSAAAEMFQTQLLELYMMDKDPARIGPLRAHGFPSKHEIPAQVAGASPVMWWFCLVFYFQELSAHSGTELDPHVDGAGGAPTCIPFQLPSAGTLWLAQVTGTPQGVGFLLVRAVVDLDDPNVEKWDRKGDFVWWEWRWQISKIHEQRKI